jgi:hypothetical protein
MPYALLLLNKNDEAMKMLAAADPDQEDTVIFNKIYLDAGSNTPILSLSKGFRGADETSFVGVVGLDVAMEAVQEMVAGMELYETGYAFLVDQEANVVVHPEHSIDSEKVVPLDSVEMKEEIKSEDMDAHRAFIREVVAPMKARQAVARTYRKKGKVWHAVTLPSLLGTLPAQSLVFQF